jgi:EmrB/QacA subfamily drug resistance transporter
MNNNTQNTEQSKWWALIGISLVSFLGCIDLTIVNTALPAIQMDLNTSITELQWVMNICLLALTGFMVIVGKLGDLYGRRLYLYIGMLLFALSSLGAGLASNVEWLIFFRFIQGIAIAVLYILPIAIIPSIFPQHHHGRATGLLVAANGVGLAIGPVIGGLIVSMSSWHWIFLINIPIILLSLVFCIKHLPESKDFAANKKIDWYGFILLATIIPAFILAIVQAESWGWLSIPILSLLAFSLIGIIGFYYIEKNVSAPIIQFDLFANRVYIVGLIANFSLAFFYAVDFFLIPLYLDYIHGLSVLQIGLTLLPATAMIAILSPMTGKMVDKHGPKGVLMAGYAFLTLSAILQIVFAPQDYFYFTVFAYILFGIGFACILSPSLVAAMSSIPQESSGVASGTVGTLHNFGGAIGLAIGTIIYTFYAGNTLNLADTQTVSEQSFLNGYDNAIGLLAVLSIVTFFIILFGLKKRIKTYTPNSKPQ